MNIQEKFDSIAKDLGWDRPYDDVQVYLKEGPLEGCVSLYCPNQDVSEYFKEYDNLSEEDIEQFFPDTSSVYLFHKSAKERFILEHTFEHLLFYGTKEQLNKYRKPYFDMKDKQRSRPKL